MNNEPAPTGAPARVAETHPPEAIAERSRGRLLIQALAISSVSAVWTLLSSVASVAIGLATESLALVAFGAIGVFDCASDVVLIVHFRKERQGLSAQSLERLAVRVVIVGLVVVGVRTAMGSIQNLTDSARPDDSTSAIAIAVVSFGVLSTIATAKRVVASRLGSRGLQVDAQLTTMGAVLGAVTVAGIAATQALDWWWADPTAALVIAVGSISLAVLTARSSTR